MQQAKTLFSIPERDITPWLSMHGFDFSSWVKLITSSPTPPWPLRSASGDHHAPHPATCTKPGYGYDEGLTKPNESLKIPKSVTPSSCACPRTSIRAVCLVEPAQHLYANLWRQADSCDWDFVVKVNGIGLTHQKQTSEAPSNSKQEGLVALALAPNNGLCRPGKTLVLIALTAIPFSKSLSCCSPGRCTDHRP
jgi:hypothetical protein